MVRKARDWSQKWIWNVLCRDIQGYFIVSVGMKTKEFRTLVKVH